jgi:HK97 gp10 family phage protein
MQFRSNIRAVFNNMDEAKETALTAVGSFVRTEAQVRCVVDTGALRDSNDYKTDLENDHVIIGNSQDYAAYVELGTSKNHAQPFLEPAVMENVPRIKRLISDALKGRLGS